MKFSFIILVFVAAVSCIKTPVTNDYVSPLIVPETFDWSTTESKPVSIEVTSTVIDQNGDTVAASIPPGDYSLITGKNTNLTIIKEPILQSVETIAANAPNGATKDVIYFPSKSGYATVMFEDLFPSKGDMDVNDVVFDLNMEFHVDNQARVRSFQINIIPRACGSFFREIALAASLNSLNGESYVREIIHSSSAEPSGLFSSLLSENGQYMSEPGNKFDVIPLTGDFRSYFSDNPELLINVRDEDPYIPTQRFSVFVSIKSNMIFPVSQLTFLEVPKSGKVNLDIFGIFGTRSLEVHFKGAIPTSFFNYAYFISTHKTDFSTADNWVWAILSNRSIKYPKEYVKIYHSYPNFKVWAESGGNTASDWYTPAVTDSLYTKE
ncbi:MAG: LruC domain-containing protein [Bacteroidales bacterium]